MTQNRKASSDRDDQTSKWVTVSPVLGAIFVRIIYALGPAALIFTFVQISRGGYALPLVSDPFKLLDQHGPAAIGIPFAAVTALFLVSFTRALDGPMSFDLFGLKSEGAAAICIIWAILFLVISLTLRALW